MASMLYLISLITLMIVIGVFVYQVIIYPYRQYRYYRSEAQRHPNLLLDLPPSFVPIVGDLLRLMESIAKHDDPFVLLRQAIRTRARFSLGFMGCVPRIALLDADVIQDVLSAGQFHRTGISQVSATLFGLLIPRSLIALEGLEWQRRRPVLAPVFRYPMMRIYAEAIANLTQTHLNDVGGDVEFAALFKRWTLSVIGTCAFGGPFSDDPSLTDETILALTDAIQMAVEYVVRPVNLIPGATWLPTPARYRLRAAIRRCRAVADEVIRRRVQGQAAPAIDCERDLLDVLLSYRSESNGVSLSLHDIRDECLLFILAGHETTSNLLAWLCVVFSREPDVLARCRAEVRAVLIAHASPFPTEADIKAMPFLHGCLLETLRLYPPAPVIARQTRTPCDLGGLRVPPGTLLRIDVWAVHHSPRYWTDPDRFDPNRFLRRDDHDQVSVRYPPEIHSHAFLPFGHGIRSCPGQAFALLEARLIMAAVLARFQVEFAPGQTFPEKITITSCPKYGVLGRLVPDPL